MVEVSKPVFAAVIALLALVVLAGNALAYREISTTVAAEVQPDGTAHASERYSFLLESDLEVEEFENLRKFGLNTVIGWKRFLPSFKYHIAGKLTPANTRISARRLFDLGARSASIELEYDVQTPLFTTSQVRGRTTRYSLDENTLSFDRVASGDVVVPPTLTLAFAVPQNAVVDRRELAPAPSSIEENKITWAGPLTAKWSLAYEVEQPLGDEVSEYFTSLYKNASSYIPVALPVALILLLAAFAYNKFVRTRA